MLGVHGVPLFIVSNDPARSRPMAWHVALVNVGGVWRGSGGGLVLAARRKTL
jgi:hypothetical protein